MNKHPIVRMFADSRVQKIYGGANEIMKELISRGWPQRAAKSQCVDPNFRYWGERRTLHQ
ncbi:Acyl-CoA dehydrogenase, C-terminal domain [Brevibacterium jeotgali]|uniref:Acyl-CoA dehydrogenase, C-terminal domain n=1 Tax=Brevibacterium jeotgali TaxID=1262550 RepID=A0A2H1L2J7_9MICO|nr:acyl-CoA dehydrogenase family protein [Brevibacterium jeotgali]SMY11127.1 Acyl-CoA dehydrogenase, C-terminal domain [Brevibacterium jeotgali]